VIRRARSDRLDQYDKDRNEGKDEHRSEVVDVIELSRSILSCKREPMNVERQFEWWKEERRER